MARRIPLCIDRKCHGAHLAEYLESLQWVRDRGVVVECCPASNWYTGAIARRSDHSAKLFHSQNLKIVLGDDNPTQTKSLLSNERRVLIQELEFAVQDLHEIDITSVHAAFVEDSAREKFISQLNEKD